MYLGFISYSSGEHYQWICKDWNEMYQYCKDDIGVLIPETEKESYFSYTSNIIDPKRYNKKGQFINKDDEFLEKDNWISITKASDYSIQQAKEYELQRLSKT